MIFHVRDLAPVEELVDAMHSTWERKRQKSGKKRSARTTAHAPAIEHPPLFLTDEDHLILVASSRTSASSGRRAVERALGDAVEYVQTQSIKPPKAAGGAGPGTRGRR